jgi:hypothetical protein
MRGFEMAFGSISISQKNQDGVRVLKKKREKKFSRAELLSLDRAGLMGVRPHHFTK